MSWRDEWRAASRSKVGARRKQAASSSGNTGGTRIITVAKPFCSPARNIITAAFQPYGIKEYSYREEVKAISLSGFARRMKIEARTFESLKFGLAAAIFLPMATLAHIEVSEKAAAWAEYVLLRTGKLYVPGKYVNPRNEAWAAKHGGKMPTAWGKGQPMIEASCSAGQKAWGPINTAMKKGKAKR